MNTNELADEIQQISNRTVNLSDKVVIAHAGLKLRQQQAEIAELKAMLGHYEDVYEGVVTHPGELTDEEVFNLEQQAYNLAMQVQNQKAEIEALKEKLNEAIDAEKDRRFE